MPQENLPARPWQQDICIYICAYFQLSDLDNECSKRACLDGQRPLHTNSLEPIPVTPLPLCAIWTGVVLLPDGEPERLVSAGNTPCGLLVTFAAYYSQRQKLDLQLKSENE